MDVSPVAAPPIAHQEQSRRCAAALRTLDWLSPDEQAKIRERMADAGIRNLSAYMRKMALNGHVLHVDLAPVKESVSL